jgi:hypothetical protein
MPQGSTSWSFRSIILLATVCPRDSPVGIAGVRVPVGQEFSFLHVVQAGSGAHPASYPMGTGGSFLAGKAAGRKGDH